MARFQLVVLVDLLAAESVAAVVLLRLLADVPFLPAAGSRRVGLPAAMRQAGVESMSSCRGGWREPMAAPEGDAAGGTGRAGPGRLRG
jgi:hypothetical protein